METDSGKIVRGFQSAYKRHGTLNLFAALEVATGAVVRRRPARSGGLSFSIHGCVVADLPVGKEIHAILDNYCIHKKTMPGWRLIPTCSFTSRKLGQLVESS